MMIEVGVSVSIGVLVIAGAIDILKQQQESVRQVDPRPAQRPAACYREAHSFPTSPRLGERLHRKPTDETVLCGTWRHGRYDGCCTG